MKVQDGAHFSAGGHLRLGSSISDPGGGTITVTGAGSRLDLNSGATIGTNGPALLEFLDGAEGSIAGTLWLGRFALNNTDGGSLRVFSGTTIVVGPVADSWGILTVGGTNSTIDQQGASTLTVGGTAGTGPGMVTVQNRGHFYSGTGLVTIHETGLINIHTSAGFGGTLRLLNGDFTQDSAGTLEIELGGTAVGQSDLLFVEGAAALDVSLIGGFAPQNGDSFQILRADGGVTNTFDFTDFPVLSPELGWSVDYTDPGRVVLDIIQSTIDGDFDDDGNDDCADVDALVAEIVAGMNGAAFDLTGDGLVDTDDLDQWRVEAGAFSLGPGKVYLEADATLDGVVDGEDFIAWNGNKFTSNNGWCGGDFNADGVTDGQDFILWNGNKFTSSDSVSAVPEPGAGMLSFVALILLAVARGRSWTQPSVAS